MIAGEKRLRGSGWCADVPSTRKEVLEVTNPQGQSSGRLMELSGVWAERRSV